MLVLCPGHLFMNYLLDSSNAAIASVTFMGSTLAGPKGNVSLDGVPLGLVNGEIVVKVGGTGPAGAVPTTSTSAPYTGAGATSASSNNTSVQIGSDVTTPRKIDIVNPNTGGIWVNRGAAAAVGSSYYLAQYGVLSVDEPTTDQFFFISPSGAQTCAYVPRTLAT